MKSTPRFMSFVTAASAAFIASSAMAQAPDPATEVARILASPAFKTSVATIDKEHERIVDEGIKLGSLQKTEFKVR